MSFESLKLSNTTTLAFTLHWLRASPNKIFGPQTRASVEREDKVRNKRQPSTIKPCRLANFLHPGDLLCLWLANPNALLEDGAAILHCPCTLQISQFHSFPDLGMFCLEDKKNSMCGRCLYTIHLLYSIIDRSRNHPTSQITSQSSWGSQSSAKACRNFNSGPRLLEIPYFSATIAQSSWLPSLVPT